MRKFRRPAKPENREHEMQPLCVGWDNSKLAVRVWHELVRPKGAERLPDRIEIHTVEGRPVEEWKATPSALVIEVPELPRMIAALQSIEKQIRDKYGDAVFEVG